MIEGIDCFKDHYILYEREKGLPQFRVTDLRNGESHLVAFPEPVYSAFPSANFEFDTHILRYSYQSLVTPSSVFDYDLDKRTSTLLKEQPVLGGYDRTQYQSERLFATAPDGVKVPISVVYKKGLKRDGSAPLYLNGYGYPAWRGGPMWYANTVGLSKVYDRVCEFQEQHGELWEPASLLKTLAEQGKTFADFDKSKITAAA